MIRKWAEPDHEIDVLEHMNISSTYSNGLLFQRFQNWKLLLCVDFYCTVDIFFMDFYNIFAVPLTGKHVLLRSMSRFRLNWYIFEHQIEMHQMTFIFINAGRSATNAIHWGYLDANNSTRSFDFEFMRYIFATGFYIPYAKRIK